MAKAKEYCECGMGPYVRVTQSHLRSTRHELALAEKQRADSTTGGAAVIEYTNATAATLGGEPDEGAQEPQEAASEPEVVADDFQAANWPLSDNGVVIRTRKAGDVDIIVDRDPKRGGAYSVHVDHEGVEFDSEVAEQTLQSLVAKADVVAAHLFDAEGAIVASYRRPDAPAVLPPAYPAAGVCAPGRRLH